MALIGNVGILSKCCLTDYMIKFEVNNGEISTNAKIDNFTVKLILAKPQCSL